MSASVISLIIQLLSGAAGGNIVGKLFKNINLGTLLNSVTGIIGGPLGGMILKMLGLAGGAAVAAGGADAAGVDLGGLDISAILKDIGAGGVGGGLLMTIIGILKKFLVAPPR